MKNTTRYLLVVIVYFFANNTLASPSILWNALIEEDLNYIRYSGESEDGSYSEILTSTASVSAEVGFDQGPAGFISLLYEQGGTPLELDEAYIFQKFESFGFTLGQHYLPFGQFNTGLANDPLTLEIAEIRASALNINYRVQDFQFHTFAYNGEKETEQQDSEIYFGARMELSKEFSSSRIHTHVDIISDVTQTDSLRPIEGFETMRVGAILGFAKFEMLNISLSVEHLVTDDFDENIIAPEKVRLQASHVELGFEGALAKKATLYSVAYSLSKDAAVLEIPEARFSLGASIAFTDYSFVIIEAFQTDAYKESDGTSGVEATGLIIRAGLALD